MPRERSAARWPDARDDADLRALARLQRALQRAIAPAACERRVRSAARLLGCDAESLALYRRMGTLRFAGEVAREFPATRALLGAARFDALARAFVARTPSRSFTLDGYARCFPAHLANAARRRPALEAAVELARLEREIARPVCARGGAALVAAPRARVLRFRHDVDAALARFERGAPIGEAPRSACTIALYRDGARAARLRLSRAEVPMLRALLRTEPLDRAVARGVASGLAPDAIGDALRRWVGARLLAPPA